MDSVLNKIIGLVFVCVLFSACGGQPEQQSEAPVSEVTSSTPAPVTSRPEPEITPTPVPAAPTPVPAIVAKKTTAVIQWNIPEERENGEELTLNEIGGYEIIYRRTNEIAFETVIIEDQTVSEYFLDNLEPGEYEFLIASFDEDGLYSEFSESNIVNLGG